MAQKIYDTIALSNIHLKYKNANQRQDAKSTNLITQTISTEMRSNTR